MRASVACSPPRRSLQEPRVKELLGIPDGYAVAALLPIGKPVKQISKLTRKPVAELVTKERFDGESL